VLSNLPEIQGCLMGIKGTVKEKRERGIELNLRISGV